MENLEDMKMAISRLETRVLKLEATLDGVFGLLMPEIQKKLAGLESTAMNLITMNSGNISTLANTITELQKGLSLDSNPINNVKENIEETK